MKGVVVPMLVLDPKRVFQNARQFVVLAPLMLLFLAMLAFIKMVKRNSAWTNLHLLIVLLTGVIFVPANAWIGAVAGGSAGSWCRGAGGCSALELIGGLVVAIVMIAILSAFAGGTEGLVKRLLPFSKIAMWFVGFLVVVAIFS